MGDARILEPDILTALAKQGIAAENVALWRGYAPRSRGSGYSPYARTYQDAVTGKNFAVISALPGCDAFGQGHELFWLDKNGVIESGNNIFHSVIEKGAVRLVALSDQPWGTKKDDILDFRPQLFIGATEIKPASDTPKLLEVDPLNKNYPYNTLEWDYGICKRRIRLIEGRFLGSWVFTVAPKGDVTIKYNQVGKLSLKLHYAIDADTEYLPRAYFDSQSDWPVIISDSATFYPEADPETSSVDGLVAQQYADPGVAWATLVADAGNAHNDSDTTAYVYIRAATTENQWRYLYRSIFLFDSSSLPDDATISAATLSLHGYAKQDNLSATPNLNIYASAPANNNDLVSGDFDSLGATAFCATPITYAGFNTSGYNAFALNASGMAAISRTGVSRFGARNASCDVAVSPPNWVSGAISYLRFYTAEQGEGYQPKLVVTYTSGATEKSASETGSGADGKTSGFPVAAVGGLESGAGGDARAAGNPLVVATGAEAGAGAESAGGLVLEAADAGAGVESLGGRDLGNIDAGTGADSPGSRDLGQAEAASGLDSGSLVAAFAANEAGSGVEAALRAVAVNAGDAGLGAELSGMLKDAVAGDDGAGTEALKWLKKTADSSAEARLPGGAGRAGRPSKKANIPSRRVNR